MDQRPKLRADTMKLLEENTGGKCHGIGFGDDFLDMMPKTEATKEKIRCTSSKIKSFYASKDTINWVKKQPKE